jgi:CBS domain-containing protein
MLDTKLREVKAGRKKTMPGEGKMTVRQILKVKGGGAVVTIAPEATLAEAAGVLAARRIGALVVTHDGRQVAGILSERDIVRQLGAEGAGCLTRRVQEVMTARIVTCTEDDTAESVMQKMTDGRFRHMPVTAGGAMVGLISIGDVVKARLDELAMEKDALTGMIMGL